MNNAKTCGISEVLHTLVYANDINQEKWYITTYLLLYHLNIIVNKGAKFVQLVKQIDNPCAKISYSWQVKWCCDFLMASACSNLKVAAPSPKQMESGCGNRNRQRSGNGCISSPYTLHDNFYSTYGLQVGNCSYSFSALTSRMHAHPPHYLLHTFNAVVLWCPSQHHHQ